MGLIFPKNALGFGHIVYFIYASLIVTLPLGDAKQSIVDMVWAGVTAVAVFLSVIYIKPARLLPKIEIAAWLIFFLYLFFSTIFSGDVGYSIYSVIRHACGFAIYYLFYTRSTSGSNRASIRLLIVFVLTTLFLNVVFHIYPEAAVNTNTMTLLFSTYGHNNVVNLVLPAAVLVITLYFSIKKKALIPIQILFSLGIIYSRSRGALGLFSASMIAVLLFVQDKKNRLMAACAVVLLAIVILILGALGRLGWVGGNDGVKSPPNNDKRIEYWRQAAYSFKDHLFFGSGPGTFYLESRRYQSQPAVYSWFAHNYILETAVELGSIGTVIMLMAWFFSIRRCWKCIVGQKFSDGHLSAAAVFVFVTLVYSFVEYNLQYYSVWIILWMFLGLVGAGFHKNTVHHKNDHIFIYIIGTLVFVFYSYRLFSVLAARFWPQNRFIILSEQLQNSGTPYFFNRIDPLDAGSALFVERVHKNNPEIFYALYMRGREEGINEKTAEYLKKALYREPQEKKYLTEYLENIIKTKNQSDIGRALIDLFNHSLNNRYKENLEYFLGKEEKLGRYLKKGFREEKPNFGITYASLAYLIGLAALQEDPEDTVTMWEIARDIYPDIGAIHIELASLYQNVLHDSHKAGQVLEECLKHPSPRLQCFDEKNIQLHAPGVYRKAML